MSTLSGTASKGEKSKPKFQSLDINSLYKHSRGENTEKPAQKNSSVYIKHGMQILGKVPSARRAPANLPSLKSEHSGSDAAVPLVPPGATGWGKQQDAPANQQPAAVAQNGANNNGTVANHHYPTSSSSSSASPNQPPQLTPHQQAIALPVTTPIPPHTSKQAAPPAPGAAGAVPSADKLWSSVMAGPQDGQQPPIYQSPQFQHEFPSLSAGDGAPARSDAPYGASGLSLRPQTEGSWTQGGQRPGAPECPVARAASGQSGGPPQLQGLAGRAPEAFPPQIRGVMPSFMYKGSFPQGGGGPAQQAAAPPPNLQARRDNGRPPRLADRDGPAEEMTPRPIIREEELSKLDEMSNDLGWAASDDIDYNQKLAFSDDESDRQSKKDVSRSHHQHHHQPPKQQEARGDRQTPPRYWNSAAPPQPSRASSTRGRSSEDEDPWVQRQRQHEKDVGMAIQRAKQRKEEEEKRFNEEKQRAAKKLQELDEKMREKRFRDRESEVGTINPSNVPPKPINHHVDIPLPEFQKEKDARSSEARPPSDVKDDGSSFRQLTSIEGKSFPSRKQPPPTQQSSSSSKAEHREQNGPSFSRQFQNDLPPRFKQQRGGNNTAVAVSGGGYQQQPYDFGRWAGTGGPESEERATDYKRQSSDEGHRGPAHSYARFYGDEGAAPHDRWSVKDKAPKHGEYGDEKRPQRPDSRRSRDGEPPPMGSWNEVMESAYEEKRAERKGAPLVPGPITKDRIEAEDVSEKRNLTQLKKGEMAAVMPAAKKQQELVKKEESAWADCGPDDDVATDERHHAFDFRKPAPPPPPQQQQHQDEPPNRHPRNQQRSFSQSKGWGGAAGSEYHLPAQHPRGSWNAKRQPPPRGGHKRDYYGHGTDSDDGSTTDNHSIESRESKAKQRVGDKDEKNRDNSKTVGEQKKDGGGTRSGGYVPKGEPSRHGRGGANFRGSRMGGLGKRIDGYGPPPSKSPFGGGGAGHHDDREKKAATAPSPADDGPNDADKTKLNQEALAAGIIGKSRQSATEEDNKGRTKGRPETRRNKSKGRKDETQDTNSENSDGKDGRRSFAGRQQRSGPGMRSRNNAPPRMGGGEKKQPYDGASKRAADPRNASAHAIADITLKGKEDGDERSEKNEHSGDSEGFQEVKSKKTSKERVKGGPDEKKPPAKSDAKDAKPERKPVGGAPTKNPGVQPTKQQQFPAQSPNQTPPPPKNTNQFDSRAVRQTKLPPRFAKQKMQKQQQQMQQQMISDGGDAVAGKLQPPNVAMYGTKEAVAASAVGGCAWDKPLGPQLRGGVEREPAPPSGMLGIGADGAAKPEPPAPSPGGDKAASAAAKSPQLPTDKPLLDGATPPVNTIIFENTNFKSAPGARGAAPRNGGDKARAKPDDDMDGGCGVFAKPINELLQKAEAGVGGDPDPIQLSAFKEDTSDMKLDFFGSDLAHLTDDGGAKVTPSKTLCMSKSMTSASSTICNADSLNMKIASVKKVWETSEQETEDGGGGISFGGPVLDPSVFKGNDGQDDGHEGYSPGPNQNASTTTNVCKVKPTQQVTGGTSQTVTTSQQQHSAIVAHAMLLGTPLSPPPMAAPAVIGAGVGLGPQQYTPAAAGQHMGFQTTGHGPAAPAGSTQYGIPTIPSPPTVLYNSTQQQLQAAAAQSGLYGAFLPTADQASVLGGQGRSQFSQYAPYHGLSQAASSPYNAQSVYLQTAAHPPPTAQAPPELYPNINSYRLSATAPFGQSQQLNNPTTVLISSTSNSLMSATVKPSNQQISAIGTKAGGVGQAYQQQSQQGQQVYMYDPSIQAANYLPSASVMQRGHAGPVQNSVMQTLQASSSYYSGSTGAQNGYFQQPANSTLQSAGQLPQHQAGYGLQSNVFGTHGQSHSNTGLQGYNSHFLSTSMQMAAAAALNAQQFMKPNPYMKSVGGGQQMGGEQGVASGNAVSGGRPQQLKSPGGQETLSSVFNSAPQIPSPKSRPNAKHMPQQSSPTAQRKYFYQGVGQQNNVQQRYPTPIQRPVNFQQQNMNPGPQNNPANQKHRSNTNKPPNRQYYSGQSNALSAGQTDKGEESKAGAESNAVKTMNASPTEMIKDNIKEEAAALKD
ncbi:uncharacterized protein LOC132702658 isoform X2 [Cylas formicarius]|uniref:uncharacterized protein LOC132702658 isoform X2 n=1 Tax=Cylas formicarius TaxID=197179 RepID=UPI002958DC81|nr:uncharacterized protein LOC132702658 isoform X2 [Cylas formicarius]